MVLLAEVWGARVLRAPDGTVVLSDPYAAMRSEWEVEQLEYIRQSYEKQ